MSTTMKLPISLGLALAIVCLRSLAETIPDTTATPVKAPAFRTAANARQWAEQQERAGNYEAASVGFDAEAARYDALGDHQAAQVEKRRARRLTTDIALAIPSEDAPVTENLARLEPARGCYLGVRDDPNGRYWGRSEANAEDFSRRLGAPVAVAFDYNTYGRPFPKAWAGREARRGRAVQIAWEPENIEDVEDDDYLKEWAKAAGESDAAIFLRFGGEMNGSWTRWGRSPHEYRSKFRLVHDVMAKYAPNVAMVWAPNAVPVTNLDAYYPGDDAVDWVGISLYLVRYYDDDLSRPGWQDSPEFFIDPFYRKYAARKPLCLVECGVTRRSRAEESGADSFAACRLQDLFDAIKIRYPRLKMACLFDRDNIENAIPGRQLNDFSLPSGSLALDSMREEARDPYFLKRFSDEAQAPIGYVPVTTNFPNGYSGPVAASLVTYSVTSSLEVSRAGKDITTQRPYRFDMPDGTGPLTITVRDGHGRAAHMETVFAP